MAKRSQAAETSESANALRIDADTNKLVNGLCDRWIISKAELVRVVFTRLAAAPESIQLIALGRFPRDRQEEVRNWALAYIDQLIPHIGVTVPSQSPGGQQPPGQPASHARLDQGKAK